MFLLRWIFSILTILLLLSWSLRWTEVESEHSIEGHAQVSYKLDRWTSQTWGVYFPPLGVWNKGINIPLYPPEKRFVSNDEVVKELEKRGTSGQLVDAWRKRDLATYIWINLTIVCLICSVRFWRNKSRVLNVRQIPN